MPGAGSIADWSPSGDVLAFAGGEETGAVELRSATTGEPIRSWEADEGSLTDLQFSPDGSLLATAGSHGVRLWDPATGQVALTLRPNSNVSGLSFSADGHFLAGVSASSGASVWDLTTGRRVGSIPTGRLFAQATALSPDGSQLAVARGVGADVYDVATEDQIRTLGGHVFNVLDVDWSPDGSRVATTGIGGIVRVWAGSSGKLLDTLVVDAGEDAGSDWSPDGSRIVTGIDVWEFVQSGRGRLLLTLPRPNEPLSDVAISPDGGKVLSADEGRTAKVWDVGVSGGAEWMNLVGQDEWNNDVVFAPDGQAILGSYPGSTVRMWDAATGGEVLTLPGHEHPGYGGEGVAGIAASPDGRLIATAGRDRTVRVWDAATGREVFAFEGHSDWVEEVDFSPDGKLLATASLDGTARIIDVASGRELRSLEIASFPAIAFGLASARFTSDGRSLVTGSWDGYVRLWDPETGAELKRIDVGAPVDNIALDPDGTRVAVVGDTASVWDLRTGEMTTTFEGPSDFAVAFSPDGERVATSSHSEEEIWVWDPDTGATELVLRAEGSRGVLALAFSPNGSRLAAFGYDGVIRVWAVELDELIEIAENELTRSFTEEECRQYLHVDACPSGD